MNKGIDDSECFESRVVPEIEQLATTEIKTYTYYHLSTRKVEECLLRKFGDLRRVYTDKDFEQR